MSRLIIAPLAGAFMCAYLGVGQSAVTEDPAGDFRTAQHSFLGYSARKTVITAADPSLSLYSTPKASGYDGIGALFIETPEGNSLCTGTLLWTGIDVLTAAHCLTDDDGRLMADRVTAVFSPAGQPDDTLELIDVASIAIKPGYSGETIDENDLAVLRLERDASAGVKRYQLFTGDPIERGFNMVGYGGHGAGASDADSAGGYTLENRRQGFNVNDFSLTDPVFSGFFDHHFGSAGVDVLMADFDNGVPAQDASCWLTGLFTPENERYCDLGLAAREANIGYGDSGAPQLIDGRIAGMASFILSFDTPPDIDNLLNSSFGEFAGYADVSRHADWIRSRALPEPGLMVMVTVLVAMVAGRRRGCRGTVVIDGR